MTHTALAAERVRAISPRTLTLIGSLMLTLATLAPVAIFLGSAPDEIPMGDAYIHFVYARNLSEHGELAFNVGMQEGIGTTSILWVLLLAAFEAVGVSSVVAAKLLGAVLLVLVGQVVFRLAIRVTARLPIRRRLAVAVSAGLLAVLPGNMVWIALSGMETMLFLALGLLALLFYARGQLALAGVALGLLALTRMEGLALAAALGLYELWRRRNLGRWVARFAVPIVLLLGPWLGFLQAREGAPLPSSFQGKQETMEAGAATFTATRPEFAWLIKSSPVLHLVSWVGYSALYMTGAAAIPGPALTFGGPIDPNQYVVSLAGVAASTTLLGALVFVTGRWVWRNRDQLRLRDPSWRLVVALMAWNVAHNVMYATLLPIPGAAGRYGPMNQLLVWEVALAGVVLAGRRLRFAAGVGVAALLALSISYWRTVYTDNIAYMQRVRIPATQFVDATLPQGAAIGSVDLGPLRYYGSHETIDMFGFINNDVAAYRGEGGRYADYLVDRQIEYLLLFGPAEDSRGDIVNFGRALGLYADERMQPTTLAKFSIPTSEWVRGSAPINNYLPAIEIVQIEFVES